MANKSSKFKIQILFFLFFAVFLHTQEIFSIELSDKPKWSILQSEMENIRQVAYSPDGGNLVLVGKVKYREQDKMIVQIRDSQTGTVIKTIEDLDTQLVVADLQYSYNGKVFGILQQEIIYLWDRKTGSLLHKHSVKGAMSMGISPDGSKLAVSVTMGSGRNSSIRVQIMDSSTGKVTKTFTSTHKSDVYTYPKFSSDGNTLFSAVEGNVNGVIAWDVKTGKIKYTAGQAGWGGNFAIHESTGKIVTYEGSNNKYNVFDLKNGKKINSGKVTTSSVTDFAIHPSGDFVILSRRLPAEFITIIDLHQNSTQSFKGFMNGGNVSVGNNGNYLAVAAFFSFQSPQNPSLVILEWNK